MPRSGFPIPSCPIGTSGSASWPSWTRRERRAQVRQRARAARDEGAGERIVCLTCYDALFARLLDESGVDILLVGDSVNQVLAGGETTLSATLEQMIYHTRIGRRGASRALVICDLPFLSYRISKADTIDRKSTRLNSSHLVISYAVFCLKK